MRRRTGYEQEEAVELMRLYQTIHADHEARRPPRCVLLQSAAAVAARTNDNSERCLTGVRV